MIQGAFTEGEQHRTSAPPAGEEKGKRYRNHTSRTMTIDGEESSVFIGLRTIPVIVKHGKKRLKINALLDDASTTTYIKTDVAEELGVHGEIEKTTFSMLNGRTETLETAPVEIGLESLNKRVDIEITAVDLLIGVDYPELHMSLKEIAGKPGEPMARLTKLGWTSVGCPEGKRLGKGSTHFARTYFARDCQMLDEIDNNIKQFWEIENSGVRADNHRITTMSKEDQFALTTVKESMVMGIMKFSYPGMTVDQRCQITDRWQRRDCSRRKDG
jgi:hypothetical protein